MKTIKLADWCDKTGVKYITAWRWFKSDKMPVRAYQTSTGTILVEDDEQTPTENKTEENEINKGISLFLKKTIEYSDGNHSIDDFAAYVLSNFELRLIGQDSPKYSRNKPKSEEVQKHFKNFIPNIKKPEPCAFIPEPEVWENLTDNTENFVGTNEEVNASQGLVNEIRENDEGALVSNLLDSVSLSDNVVEDLQPPTSLLSNVDVKNLATIGGTITYLDLTPHNYTYSTSCVSNSLLGTSLSDNQVFVNFYNAINDKSKLINEPGPNSLEKAKRGRPRKKNND